jgi:hypothetical protein
MRAPPLLVAKAFAMAGFLHDRPEVHGLSLLFDCLSLDHPFDPDGLPPLLPAELKAIVAGTQAVLARQIALEVLDAADVRLLPQPANQVPYPGDNGVGRPSICSAPSGVISTVTMQGSIRGL